MGRYFWARALAWYAASAAAFSLMYVTVNAIQLVAPRADRRPDIYVVEAGYSAVVAVVLFATAILLDRSLIPGRRSGRLRLGAGSIVLAVVGVAAMGYGLLLTCGAIWYDFTYVENGGIGASFAALGVWLGFGVVLPAASALLAGAARVARDPAASTAQN